MANFTNVPTTVVMATSPGTTSPLKNNWLLVRNILLGLIMLVTLVLNTFLIIVLRKMKSRRCKTDSASYMIEKSYMYLLFHLAFSDMLGVTINIPIDILDYAGIKYIHHAIGCTLLAPIQLASTSAQAGTYVALSYHRFRAIVYPIRANLTVCKSVIMICIIWAVGISLSLPFAIVHRLTNGTCEEEWPQGTLSSTVYTFAIFIVQYAAPVTLMAIFYISIARALHEHRSPSDLGKTHAQEDIRTHRRIVRMLVTIVTVYSVCMLPHHLLWIINSLEPMGKSTFDIWVQVSYLFTYSNTVANPAVFFLYNKESRFHLKQLLRKYCKICYRPKLDIPFEIDVNMWSGSLSGNSKSDNNNQSERKSLRTDRVRLNQLFPTQPGDSDLGVSLPWEAQVLSGSHDTIDGIEECREFEPSITPPVRDILIDTMDSPMDKPSNLDHCPTATSENVEAPSGSQANDLKMDGINEDEDEGPLSEDETERVQNMIRDMVVDLKREIQSHDGGYYGDTLSSDDMSGVDDAPDSGDMPKNENPASNDYVTNDGNTLNVNNTRNEDVLNKEGNVVRNGHIVNSGGKLSPSFDDSGNANGSEFGGGSFSETRNKHVTGSQELVNDAIHFLDQQSPSPVRNIDELREHLWNLREDDV